MKLSSKIAPCLWFDNQGEDAAKFYISIFPDSRILKTSHFTEAGHEIHGRAAGSLMAVQFEISGQQFTALNGGPGVPFTDAISLQINCETQDEVDYYWEKLLAGGAEVACGWLKDKFGVSWQVVPTVIHDLFTDADPAKSARAMQAMLKMKKLDIAALKKAYAG